jgi:cell fate regulator YaaT (PSP1 superfamily)
VVGVRFKGNGRIYYFSCDEFHFKVGDHCIVETERGKEFGTVVLREAIEEKHLAKRRLKSVLRKADPGDVEIYSKIEEREKEAFTFCVSKIKQRELPMKLVGVDYAFDGSKATFYFTADGRIDFRELVKDLVQQFHTRIEMRQIGVRDEAKMRGGYGACGRPLCCSCFLKSFEPVSIKMAKKQSLSLNPSKISGTCGRLMCCLAYEDESD